MLNNKLHKRGNIYKQSKLWEESRLGNPALWLKYTPRETSNHTGLLVAKIHSWREDDHDMHSEFIRLESGGE